MLTTKCAECGHAMEAQAEFDQCVNAACPFFLYPVNDERDDADDDRAATRDRIWEDAW